MKIGKLSLTNQILIATVAGIVFGSIVGPWASNLKFLGDIFLRLIQMSVVILVMTSVIGAIGGGDGEDLGKMGTSTIKWILTFTIFSALLAVVLSLIIRPGEGITIQGTEPVGEVELGEASLTETIKNFVPTNIIQAMAEGNMVQCIVFSILFGLAMGAYTKATDNRHIVDLVKGTNDIIVRIIEMVMNIAPIGIFCLLADVAGSTGFAVIIPMLKFLGLQLIGTIIMLLVYSIVTALRTGVDIKKMPAKFKDMSIMALTTTSGAVTLPIKMRDTYEEFGVSRRVTEFTGPITMSMNSCGACLCYVAAIFFMAQSTGVELTTFQMVMAMILSILMCLGTISVPGGSVIVYTFLADSMGLPLEAISVLIGIDWFAGMFRTLVNVDADVMVAMLVADELDELDHDVYNGNKVVEY